MRPENSEKNNFKLIIPQIIFDSIMVHCAKEYPNEACGILAGRDMIVSAQYAMTNIESSPASFFMHPAEQFRVMKELRDRSLMMVGVYHSHPSSPAYPSTRDKELAYDDVVHIIVSLLETIPVVRGFLMQSGRVREIEIAVDS